MNELQIRLTADIKDLQSAINKAKATLKSFESETATGSEKSNVGFRRKIGLIEQLTAKAKSLKVSLSQATNEQQIASFNAELEQTNQELARLNALGKSFAAPAVKSFNNLKSSVGAANGSAVAFNRIIQDAPFGLLGVGNNIQQFTEQIAFLKKDLGSTSAAVKSFFGSLFTSTNLLILAVSAVTAGFTAYQMGAFDSKDATEDLTDSLNKYKDSLDSVSRAELDSVQNAQTEIQAFKLLQAQAENVNISLDKRLRAVNEIKKEFPDYIKGLSDEEILTGKVGDAYKKLTEGILAQARARTFSKQIAENDLKSSTLQFQEQERALEILNKREEENILLAQKRRGEQGGQFVSGQDVALSDQISDKTKEINELINQTILSSKEREKLENQNLQLLSKIPGEIEKAGGLIDDNNDKIDKAKEKVEFYDKAWNENEDRLIRISQLARAIADETPAPAEIKPEEDPADVTPKGRIEFLEEQIALFEFLKRLQTDTGKIDEYTLKIAQLRQELDLLNGKKVDENLTLIVDAFSSLGAGIAASLNIGDRALRGFVTTLLSATPKIIGAIIAQASARRLEAAAANSANAQVATGNAIVTATEGAKGLGPVGLALLPVFIAGAVALVSAAFGKAGSGGGSAPSAGSGSTFTNRREFGGPVSKGRAYIVGEKRPELFVPNTNGIIVPQVPSMDYSGASVSSGMYGVEVMLKGPDDLLFFVEQAQIRRNIR
jgi:hypothetical protein